MGISALFIKRDRMLMIWPGSNILVTPLYHVLDFFIGKHCYRLISTRVHYHALFLCILTEKTDFLGKYFYTRHQEANGGIT